MVQRRFTFNIQLSGVGENPEEAWLDATEAFDQDPGICPEIYTEEEHYDEGNNDQR